MDTLRAIIVEDEKKGQEVLSSLIEIYCPSIKILSMAEDVSSAISQIKKHKPDLVFLDIVLGNESSFDILEKLKPIDFQVIFTTSLEDHALDAFKVNAVDYLLKPIDPDELIKAVEKTQKLIDSSAMQNKWADLFQSFSGMKTERIAIPSRDKGISILELDEILYVEGDGPYSTFHTQDGRRILASKNLGHFTSILSEHIFYRTHQSYLVHKNFIKRIIPNDGLIELSNGIQMPLARNRRNGLMELLGI